MNIRLFTPIQGRVMTLNLVNELKSIIRELLIDQCAWAFKMANNPQDLGDVIEAVANLRYEFAGYELRWGDIPYVNAYVTDLRYLYSGVKWIEKCLHELNDVLEKLNSDEDSGYESVENTTDRHYLVYGRNRMLAYLAEMDLLDCIASVYSKLYCKIRNDLVGSCVYTDAWVYFKEVKANEYADNPDNKSVIKNVYKKNFKYVDGDGHEHYLTHTNGASGLHGRRAFCAKFNKMMETRILYGKLNFKTIHETIVSEVEQDISGAKKRVDKFIQDLNEQVKPLEVKVIQLETRIAQRDQQLAAAKDKAEELTKERDAAEQHAKQTAEQHLAHRKAEDVAALAAVRSEPTQAPLRSHRMR